MVESAAYDTVPRVTKYQAIELRDTGVKVLSRGGWKFIGPALGRKWFTDREKMVRYVKALVANNLRIFLGRARECADALTLLPVIETHVVPPAERSDEDLRPDV